MPWELIVSRPAFARAAHGIRPPGGVYCHVSGCDLVRDADGSWKVLEDNVRTPSGISYVLENRVAMTRLLPGLFAALPRAAGRPLPGAAAHRAATRSRRPAARRRRPSSSGRRARSTPPTSSTRSSPARWASSSSRRPTSWSATPSATSAPPTGCSACTRSTAGSTTTSWTRSSSAPTRCSACPGLMRAYRAGTRGDRQRGRHRRRRRQGDLPLRAGDDPLLPRRGADPRERPDLPDGRPPSSASTCSSGSTEMVVKPTSESGGKGVFIGPTASDEEIARQADAIVAPQPERWIAQELVRLSTVPDRDGRTARSRRATSTCGRSRCSATTSTSSPAGSRASRCARAR